MLESNIGETRVQGLINLWDAIMVHMHYLLIVGIGVKDCFDLL